MMIKNFEVIENVSQELTSKRWAAKIYFTQSKKFNYQVHFCDSEQEGMNWITKQKEEEKKNDDYERNEP